MADSPNPADPNAVDPNNPNPNGSPPPTGDKGDDKDKVPTTWDEIFKHPRFKQLSDTAAEAKKQLDAAEKAKQDAARQKEIEAGNHQKVIDELTPKAKRAEELESALNTVIEAEINNIPEARRSLVPDLPPEKKLAWITANRAILMGDKKKDVNTPANPAGDDPKGGNQKIFTHEEIKDPKFYKENRDEILKAQREGRIRD